MRIIYGALLVVFTLTAIIAGYSYQDYESLPSDFCPFGICMGDNPDKFYASEEHKKLGLYKPFVNLLDIKAPWDMSEILDDNSRYELYDYQALYSDETGICMVQLFVSLQENKVEKLLEKMNDYLNEFQLGLPSIKVIESGKYFEWSGNSLQKAGSISSIKYGYWPGVLDKSGFMLRFYFDNFTKCRIFEPSLVYEYGYYN